MKTAILRKRSGFTLMETVIAIGVLAVLLTAFMYVFGPAMAGIRKSMLLAIDGAWAPSDYPSTISDLLAMVPDERSRKQLATMLCHVLMNDSIRQPGALVTMQTSTGPCVLGLRFERNLISPKQNDWASRPVLTGFRDALPLQVLVNRCRTMKVFG